MRHTYIAAALLATGCHAGPSIAADTLAADSLYCEGADGLDAYASDVAPRLPLDTAGAAATLEAARSLQAQAQAAADANQVVVDTAARINARDARAGYFPTPANIQAARTAAAHVDRFSAAARTIGVVTRTCGSSGPRELQARVLETKPASGYVLIRVQLGGRDADVWAHADAVSKAVPARPRTN